MKFSVATFNVENLITAGKPIYDEPKPKYTPQQYQQKVDWIKSQLIKMDADIVGFQEIFEEQALRDCIADTPYSKWNLYVANPNGKSPVNALLSKFDVINNEVINDIPSTFDFFDQNTIFTTPELNPISIPIKNFSRGILKSEIKLNDFVTIVVYIVHLKSKRPIFANGINRNNATYFQTAQGSIRSLIRRGIEACGVRQLLSDQVTTAENKPVIILGDLNDNDNAVTSQAILGEPPFHQLPIDERITRWKHVFQNSKDVQARKIIENFHYTYIYNGHYESLDNIFLSNHFADLNNKRLGRIIDVRLYNDHVIDSTISLDRKPIFVTDHGQVVVNIDLFDPQP